MRAVYFEENIITKKIAGGTPCYAQTSQKHAKGFNWRGHRNQLWKARGGGDETKMEKSSVVCSSLAGKTGCPGANGAATVAAGVAAKGSRGASQGQRQLRVGRADGHALTPGTRGIRAKQTGSWPTPPLPGASHQRCGRNPPQVLVFRFPVECTTLGSM